MSDEDCLRVRGIIFDADDTLWVTEELYDRARSQARHLVEASGFDGARWEELQRGGDMELVPVLGHDPDRFPRSCREAIRVLAPANERLIAAVDAAARDVFVWSARLQDGVVEVLDRLRREGRRLALLTKGDPAVQRRRLDSSGLTERFDVVRIVPDKTVATFAGIAEELGLAVNQVVSVGNSPASDIEPSIAAGIRAIHIPAYVWDWERRPGAVDPSAVVDSIREVPAVLSSLEQASGPTT